MNKFDQTFNKLINEDVEMISEGTFGKVAAGLGLIGAMAGGTLWHANQAEKKLNELPPIEQNINSNKIISADETSQEKLSSEIKSSDNTNKKQQSNINQSSNWIESIAVPFLMDWEGAVTDKDGNHIVYDDYVHDKVKRRWDGKSSLTSFIKSCKGKPTIGFGITYKSVINKGKISESEAKKLLIQTLKKLDEHLSKKFPYYRTMTPNQKTALLSFSYNLGSDFIETKTVKMKNALIKGDLQTMADEMLDCNNVTIDGEKVQVRGLTNRRNAERQLILNDL